MEKNLDICPDCGGAVSKVLAGNCPSCLMRLSLDGVDSVEEPASGETDAPARAEWQKRLGDYELLEEIAHGGMGVIFRARQRSLKRLVSVKVLLGGHFAGEMARKRFRREAESAAALNHPNIVSIYEAGEDSGQLYLAMELVEGRSFAELTREQPLDPGRAAALMKAVAEAVQYAHEHNVLHRDLKPSNVILDHLGHPRITDFGLAKLINSDEDVTLTGQLLGSPNYMPPEQADPNRGRVTRASDVYSLGAILYQLLTGRPPFQANSLTSTLQQVLEQEPVSARLLNPSVPRDLDTICAKCLEKDPKRRFASARDLADELTRFLDDQPILSRPAGRAQKLGRWCRRNPMLAVALFSAAFLLIVIVIGAPVAVWRIDRERAKAQRAERDMRQQLYTALLDQSRVATLSAELGHRIQTLEALRRAAAITNATELRREALAAFRLPDLRLEREVPRLHPGSLTAWALDPAFQRVAEVNNDESIQVSDAANGNVLAKLAPQSPGPADQITWSPDGRYLALKRGAGGDSQHWSLEVWDTSAYRCVCSAPTLANRPVFRPDSHAIFNANADGTISVVDLVGNHKAVSYPSLLEHPVINPQDRGLLIAIDSAGKEFVQSHIENTASVLKIRRTDDGAVLRSINIDSPISAVAWQPRGTWIALADWSGAVSLLDAATGNLHSLGHHKVQAISTVFTPDGHYLFTGGWERELICWDMDGLQKSFIIPLDSYNLQVNAEGTRCALDTKNSWQIHHFERSLAQRTLMEAPRGRAGNVAFSPAGGWVVVIGQNRAGVWPLRSQAPPAFVPLLPEDGTQERAAFCSDNEFYLWRDSSCERWRIAPGEDPYSAPKLAGTRVPLPPGLISISPTTNGVVITSPLGSAMVTAEAREPKWTPTESGLSTVSPDGRWLSIFPPYSKVARIYELPSFAAVTDLTNASSISRVEFSPYGPAVALCSMWGCSLWSTAGWKLERVLTNQMDLMFAANGKSLWLMGNYRSGGLYSASGLQPLLPLPRGTLPLATSRDGGFLVASTGAGFIELWDLAKLRQDLRKLGLDWSDP